MATPETKTTKQTSTPDELVQKAQIELTEDELKSVAGGVDGESADHKHKDE